jgi:hypothetical protein
MVLSDCSSLDGDRLRRGFGFLRLGWSGVLVTCPRGLVKDDRWDRRLARILAVRHACQGVVTATDPTPGVVRVGAGVDLLHAASMVVLACVASRRRRSSLVDAAVATAAAAAGLGLVRA